MLGTHYDDDTNTEFGRGLVEGGGHWTGWIGYSEFVLFLIFSDPVTSVEIYLMKPVITISCRREDPYSNPLNPNPDVVRYRVSH